MKFSVYVLILISFFMHLRLVGINLTVYGIFFSTVFGLYFFLKYFLRQYKAPVAIASYLSIFLLIGIYNQNNFYYTIYDFVKLISLSGFFLFGYYYFKHSKRKEFLKFLHYSSRITIVLFFITFLIVIYLWKIVEMKIYAQVQLDLVFLVMLSMYEKKYLKLLLFLSVLSLKRMILVSVAFIFIFFTKKDKLFLLNLSIFLGFLGFLGFLDFLDFFLFNLPTI